MLWQLSAARDGYIESFRAYAKEIRRADKPYRFRKTETEGVLNILIGLGQLAVAPCFKCFKAEKLSQTHHAAGKQAIRQGIIDLKLAYAIIGGIIFGLAFIRGMNIAERNWTVIK